MRNIANPRRASTRSWMAAFLGLALASGMAGAAESATPRATVRAHTPWLATDGRTTAIGWGRHLAIHHRDGTPPAEILLDAPATSGALQEGSLLVLTEEGDLLHVDPADPTRAERLPLPRTGHRVSLLASMGATLVVADPHRGLELLAAAPSHRGHHAAPHEHSDAVRRWTEAAAVALVPLPEKIVAMTAQPDRAVVVLEDGSLEVIERGDAAVNSTPAQRRRRIDLGEPARAAALSSGRLYALVPSGLVRIDLANGDDAPVRVARLGGAALAVVGREVTILSEDAELSRIIDREPAAMQHNVTVLEDNTFSPGSITILPGDTVRWSNASAGFHNVVSCTAEQDGCSADAAESFDSGPVSSLWVLTHEFTQPGESPYICQPHAPFMTGTVIVEAPPAPPPVPDGRDGSPMTVQKTGTSLSIAWDEVSCGTAGSYHLIWGHRGNLPAAGGPFSIGGSVCGIASPFVWSTSPDPAAVPGKIIWWLILPGEGVTEGSWGVNSMGAERAGPASGGSSGACGVLSKDVSAGCNQ